MGIRAFVAVELDAGVRAELAALEADLKRAGADVKWVEPENLHLTLKFLGQVEEGGVSQVCAIMDEAVAGVEPFPLRVVGTGSFPAGRRPRVVWVGAQETGGYLADIHRRLERGLRLLGVPPEGRAFVTHVTLGRVRSGRGADRLASALARTAERDFGEVTVETVTLFESVLGRVGPTYTPLYRARLGSGNKEDETADERR